MSDPSGQTTNATPTATHDRRSDRSAWYWLLAVPLLTVLYPPLYNRTHPELLGIPFFYWYQLAMIPVSMLCTVLVYRATRRPSAQPAAPTGREVDR